jgi:hypothetical protein
MKKMIRGTTPTLEFIIPFDTGILAEAFVTLSQRGNIVIDKALDDCHCNDKKLSVRLTQEETLKLECDCITEIQIRARTQEGEAVASNIIKVHTERILKDGVI